MNEEEVGKKLISVLNSGLEQISQKQLARLESVRERSLARVESRQTRVGLAMSINGGASFLSGSFSHIRGWTLAIMLLLVLASFGGWYALLSNNDTLADDAELLEDELPLHAYLDHDFDPWLNR